MTEIDQDAPVLVTGAGGYVASWIVRQLLEAGRTVRGTVRDPNRTRGLEHLRALADAHPGRLSLHGADLLESNSFTPAMEGCQLVLHTASPFIVGRIRDAEAELIRPALEGTRNVLSSVEATPSVRRVVLTSSIAAVYGDNNEMRGRGPFDDSDWNTTSSPTHKPYEYSKTVAEREAWEMVSRQTRWDLVTVLPGLVLGPSLTTSSRSGSMSVMKHFTDFSLTFGAPALTYGMVDVRDVADAHIRAGFTPAAHGRYIANAGSLSFLDMGRILRSAYGPRLAFPRFEAPKWLIWLLGPTAHLSHAYVEENVGYPVAFDTERTVAELGVSFRPVAESVVEHYAQMQRDGMTRPWRRPA